MASQGGGFDITLMRGGAADARLILLEAQMATAGVSTDCCALSSFDYEDSPLRRRQAVVRGSTFPLRKGV